MLATQRSKMARSPRMMQAPAIAPDDEGRKVLNRRLSPPPKCSQGTIIAMSMTAPSLGDSGVGEAVGIGIGIDMSMSMVVGEV